MESEFRIGDLGLDEAVLIEGTEDDESNQEVITTQTIPNTHYRTY